MVWFALLTLVKRLQLDIGHGHQRYRPPTLARSGSFASIALGWQRARGIFGAAPDFRSL
jgi:hypothetical protein